MTTATDVIAAENGTPAAGLPPRTRSCSIAAAAAACSTPNGRSYLDLISGVGVAALGHAHPRLAAAIADQAQRAAAHVEPVLPSAAGRAGDAAVGAVGPAARVLLQQRRRGGRSVPEVRAPLLVRAGRSRAPRFVAFEHSFHGRTMGALSVTWDDHYRAPFEPLIAGRDLRRRRRYRGARGRGHGATRLRSSSSRSKAKAACGRSAQAMADAIADACQAHRARC